MLGFTRYTTSALHNTAMLGPLSISISASQLLRARTRAGGRTAHPEARELRRRVRRARVRLRPRAADCRRAPPARQPAGRQEEGGHPAWQVALSANPPKQYRCRGFLWVCGAAVTNSVSPFYAPSSWTVSILIIMAHAILVPARVGSHPICAHRVPTTTHASSLYSRRIIGE